MQTPAIVKPKELWTGKQVLSVLLRPSSHASAFINLTVQEKNYTAAGHMCPHDGYVCIANSELISGQVGKGLLGGSKGGLFSVMAARYSPAAAGVHSHMLVVHDATHASLVCLAVVGQVSKGCCLCICKGDWLVISSQIEWPCVRAAACMVRLSKLSARYIGEQGFSIGIGDVTPAAALREEKAQTLAANYKVVNEYVRDFKAGALELLPGCSEDESLEVWADQRWRIP